MIDLTAVRFAVFDFDGVFSDNRVWTNDRGEESVACFRVDTMGLRRLDEVGVEYLILTSETNDAVAARARKMRVDIIKGVEDKLPVLHAEVDAVDRGEALPRVRLPAQALRQCPPSTAEDPGEAAGLDRGEGRGGSARPDRDDGERSHGPPPPRRSSRIARVTEAHADCRKKWFPGSRRSRNGPVVCRFQGCSRPTGTEESSTPPKTDIGHWSGGSSR